MKNEKEFKQKFTIINFNETYVPPTINYNKRLKIVEWGKKNDHPMYLLGIYNNFGSPLHKNIVNKKNKFVSGNGFEEFENEALNKLITKNKLKREVKKISLDHEIFNGFAIEVIWDNAGENIASIQHIPFHKLRVGIEDEDASFPHVWFSNDWSQHRKAEYTPELIREFNPLIKKGKQIYYFTDYNPEAEIYPIPNYSNVLNFIELDYEISKFHLNQAKQGYAPSFILNFATGIPTEDEMEEFSKNFKKNYSGTENAGKIIITYSEGSDGKPELTAVDLNDSDERFVMLMEQIELKIASGAEIPLPLIQLVPGKLGSTEERRELLSEFQQSYVTPRQETIEEVLNEILSAAGFTEEVKLKTFEDDDVKIDLVKESENRANLRASDAGMNGIISIRDNVAGKALSMDAARAMLGMFYNYDEEEIDVLLSGIVINENPEIDNQKTNEE